MNSNTRGRRAGVFLATVAAVMLAAPTAVLAHGGDREEGRHRGRGVVWFAHARPWTGNPMRARLARAGRVHESTRYYCAACRHPFVSARELRRHVHHHHHVPLWRVPFVIAHGILHGAFAWIFYG